MKEKLYLMSRPISFYAFLLISLSKGNYRKIDFHIRYLLTVLGSFTWSHEYSYESSEKVCLNEFALK